MLGVTRFFARLAVGILVPIMFFTGVANQVWATTPSSARRHNSRIDDAVNNGAERMEKIRVQPVKADISAVDPMCVEASREAAFAAGEQFVDQLLQQAHSAPRRLTETQMKLLSCMLFEDGPTHVYGLARAAGLKEETTRTAMVTLANLGFVERATEADTDGRYPYRIVARNSVYEAIIAEQERRNAEVTKEATKLLKLVKKLEEGQGLRRKAGFYRLASS